MNTHKKPFTADQAHGLLIGMAIGDALGAQHMLQDPHRRGSLPDLNPGQWTSITSTALCVAQMLRSANGWDAEDAMRRFVNWRDYGYLSSTKVCFGMSPEMEAAIDSFKATGNPYGGKPDKDGAEALARVAPAVLAYAGRKESVEAIAILQCKLTHGAPTVLGAAKKLSEVFMTPPDQPLAIPANHPGEVPDTTSAVLNAALWAYGEGDGFEEKLQAAIQLGGPSDKIGALLGQIIGRRIGYDALPAHLLASLYDHDKIFITANDLHVMRPIDV